jgi:hypothetical protein
MKKPEVDNRDTVPLNKIDTSLHIAYSYSRYFLLEIEKRHNNNNNLKKKYNGIKKLAGYAKMFNPCSLILFFAISLFNTSVQKT